MEKTLKKSLKLKVLLALLITSLAAGAFSWHIKQLHQQLLDVFRAADPFIPTRIYSDLIRLHRGENRARVEKKLARLGYEPQHASETSLKFELHSRDYPLSLIPPNHPQAHEGRARDGTFVSSKFNLELIFDRKGSSASLLTLWLSGQELNEVYLEPEVVATISRNPTAQTVLRTSIKFDEYPPEIWKAIIAIEDQNFLDHKGLEIRSLVRALLVNLRTQSYAQGGSTITQQLVKNLSSRRSKNLIRKVNETFLSILLELEFDKETILERYLNEVYLGQVGGFEVHGIAEGALYFFGKRVSELSLGESALLAGLIRGPSYYSPYRFKERALERQRLVLQRMQETGAIAEQEAQEARDEVLNFLPAQNISNKAPYFVDYVKVDLARLLAEHQGERKNSPDEDIWSHTGFRIYTTLDLDLSVLAQEQLNLGIDQVIQKLVHKEKNKTRLKTPKSDPSPNPIAPAVPLEGALAVIEPQSGRIRALIGGKQYSLSTFNRVLNMKRQVGSTFKPIVYLGLIEKRMDSRGIPIGGGTPFLDAPWTLRYDQQIWSPNNFSKNFQGWMGARNALIQSVNVIAAKVGHEVGIPDIIKLSRRLGISSPLPAVPSLALGVAELSPIEVLGAYATFANRGVYQKPSIIREITWPDGTPFLHLSPESKEASDAPSVDLLNSWLQDVLTEGTAKSIQNFNFDRPAAGKTGTTNLYRDAWFAGYTPEMACVVWVGMDHMKQESELNLKLTGANSALPIWTQFMKAALADSPPLTFPQSPSLLDIAIDSKSGFPARDDCPSSQVAIEKLIEGTFEHLPQKCEDQKFLEQFEKIEP